MSESYLEQHPLLETFDEDQYSPRFQRRSMVLRSHMRSKLKGAAAIIRSWPDHWTSFVVYWWMGLGMLTLTTMILYSYHMAMAFSSSERLPMGRFNAINIANTPSDKIKTLPKVFMHVFIDTANNFDAIKYFSYIENVSKKYVNYEYHLILVIDDADDTNPLSAEQNNEIALNAIMDKYNTMYDNVHGIKLEQVSLSKCFNDSPLRKHWRNLPRGFLEFLIRAIYIWENGGIAFNPIIITPYTPNYLYTKKLHNILERFNEKPNHLKIMNVTETDSKKIINTSNNKPAKKINNIRDIIDAMERNEDITIFNQQNLAEAETKDNFTLSVVEQSVDNRNISNAVTNKTSVEPTKYHYPKLNKIKHINNLAVNETDSYLMDKLYGKSIPSLLKLLLNHKESNITNYSNEANTTTLSRKRKSVTPLFNTENKYETAKYKPMIISSNSTRRDNIEVNEYTNNGDDKLIIDVKGYILATRAPCHAFIGTVFSNIHSCQHDSLDDYIIHELSLFCQGLLSKCNGIDVILS